MIRLKELSDKEHNELMSGDFYIPEEVTNWLLSKGLKRIGNESHFSLVYGKSGSNKIVKINKRNDGGYHNFVKMIYRKNFPLFPHIYDYKELMLKNLYLYITERLNEIPKSYFSEHEHYEKYKEYFSWLEVHDMGPWIGEEYTSKYSYWFGCQNVPNFKNIFPDYQSFIENEETTNEKNQMVSLIKQTSESFEMTEEGQILKTLISSYSWDGHADNYMIRPNTNDLVLIDPVGYKINWNGVQ